MGNMPLKGQIGLTVIQINQGFFVKPGSWREVSG